MQHKLLFVVGPTASGKSAFAIELAQKLNGEIICADSQTLHRELDIGTAKPTLEDRRLVPHHLLDTIGPYETYSVANFKKAAEAIIKDIQGRHKTAIVVGGSGLYIDALFYDYSFKNNARAVDKNLDMLSVDELQQLIKKRRLKLPKNEKNPRHLIGVLRRGAESDADRYEQRNDAYILGLLWPDDVLRSRINERVERMFQDGFLEEVKRLADRYGAPPKDLDAIGYPIGFAVLNGDMTVDQAKELFKTKHWQYARKQKAWFKRNNSIKWLDPSEDLLRTALGYIATSK